VLASIWNILVTSAIIFVFVMWFWLLITIIGDIFRRDDTGGFSKLLWILFLLFLPLLGAFFYILTQSKGMAERQQRQVAKAREDLREFVGVGAADELEKLDRLKAAGSITEAEYAKLRARVIG
jgi:hypothetical protein